MRTENARGNHGGSSIKTLRYLAIALIVLAFGSAAQAQLKIVYTDTNKLYITLATVGTAQALDHKNVFDSKGAPLAKVEPGFQNAFGDLGFVGKFGKNAEIEIVFDMYLSSRNHPSQTYGNEGYIILRGVPENMQGLKFLAPVLENAIDRIEDGEVARWKGFPQPTFQMRVPVNTLRCGNGRMERDMYRALRSEAYPAIEFRFQELIGGVNHDIDAGRYHAKIAGVLSLAGQSRRIAVDVVPQRVDRQRFRLRATLPLRMTDFRITPPTALFGAVKAKDELMVQFDLLLQSGAQ